MSLCNNLAVTIRMVLKGIAIGLIPIRVMQEHLQRREVRVVDVSPEVGGHRVFLCYQVSEFGPKLQQVLDVTRTVLVEQQLFT